MTGYGAARGQADAVGLAVEVKTVNNRYLKVSMKCSDVYSSLEHKIQKTVREFVARGSVQIAVRLERVGASAAYSIDDTTLKQYIDQLRELADDQSFELGPHISSLIGLPGVIVDGLHGQADAERDWPFVESVLRESLVKLTTFREDEGRSMYRELVHNCDVISEQLAMVSQLAPDVAGQYRERILERVNEMLASSSISLEADDVLREVSLFADRSDINEEITRLMSHLEQFRQFLAQQESMGRKLEFVGQEMFREVNTIGAKANNADIARCVVEMKSAIEKNREILQNVE